MEILFATKNLHKYREIKKIFQEFLPHVEFRSLLDFSHYKAPEETGLTFQENALIKARHAFEQLELCVVADDSGLVVPALNGEPGVYSARYAGEQKNDSENRKKLLQKILTLKPHQRFAFFECSLALVYSKEEEICTKGVCEGKIIHEEKGSNGFGYDPIFVKNDYDKTFAQLSESTKNKVSHRRKAIDNLLFMIEKKKLFIDD